MLAQVGAHLTTKLEVPSSTTSGLPVYFSVSLISISGEALIRFLAEVQHNKLFNLLQIQEKGKKYQRVIEQSY